MQQNQMVENNLENGAIGGGASQSTQDKIESYHWLMFIPVPGTEKTYLTEEFYTRKTYSLWRRILLRLAGVKFGGNYK